MPVITDELVTVQGVCTSKLPSLISWFDQRRAGAAQNYLSLQIRKRRNDVSAKLVNTHTYSVRHTSHVPFGY
jgi:hypothetical protein